MNKIVKPKVMIIDYSLNCFKVKGLKLYLVIILLALLASQNIYAQQQETSTVDSSVVEVSSITLSRIADKYASGIQDIRGRHLPIIQDSVLYKTISKLDNNEVKTSQLEDVTIQLLDIDFGYTFYESLLIKWSQIINEIEKLENTLKSYTQALAESEDELIIERQVWEVTKTEAKSRDLSNEIINQIDYMIGSIDTTLWALQDSMNKSVLFQSICTDIYLIANSYTDKIQENRKVELNERISNRNSPLWNLDFKKDTTRAIINKKLLNQFRIEDSKSYFESSWKELVWILVLFILMMITLIWLKKEFVNHEEKDSDLFSEGRFIISNPVTSAFMFASLVLIFTQINAPLYIGKLFGLIFLIPFLLLFRGVVRKPLSWSLYYFFIVFILSNLTVFYFFSGNANRIILFVVTLAIGGFILWFLLNRKKIKPETTSELLFYRFLKKIGPIYFLIISIAFLANIIGYDQLAQVLNYGTLISIMMALILGTAYLGLKSILFFFMHSSVGMKSYLIIEKQNQLFTGIRKLLWFITVVFWLYSTLKKFLIWETFNEWLLRIWDTGYQFGNLSVTIGNILSFILIVIFSWAIAYALKALLHLEVLRRLKLPRGMPNAISSLLYYFLVLTGFLLALAYAGFNMQNLGLLAGALGFGIGFGLQNLIGNFIAGLILAFERPVTVGDYVSVDNLEGYVIKVGIRTSIIRQFDGSQLIVPNSDLISNKVTNWSLSQIKKRYILKVRVHLDSDPDNVLKLMSDAVNEVKDVLKDPQAEAYFHGIIDQSLEFALYYWVSKNLLQTKSDVTLSVQKALKKAEIIFETPMPIKIQEDQRNGITTTKK